LAIASSGAKGNASSLPLRDLDQIRQFMGGPATIAIADLPWVPIFVLILFLFHPLFGIAVAVAVAILISLAIVCEFVLRDPTRHSSQLLGEKWEIVDQGRRGIEALRALGMIGRFSARFETSHREYVAHSHRSSDLNATFTSITKIFRLAFQSAMLALGAALVLDHMASPGTIIAASILSSKALGPIESSTAQWRTFLAARQSMKRLDTAICNYPESKLDRTALPLPVKSFAVSDLSISAPGNGVSIIHEISFALRAGECLGIVGPSGSGKSSLGKALVGAWPLTQGTVRLDGAELKAWDPDYIGAKIGYLPQEIELFSGTIAENISRFTQGAEPEMIIEAAKSAGVHELILSMPNGYDTPIGIDGAKLSGGQRQRVALARALFGRPFLIVLDEPNSNLDGEGEMALGQAISTMSRQGAIVVVIAHRANVLQLVDQVLVLRDGKAAAHGPREELVKMLSPEPPHARKVA